MVPEETTTGAVRLEDKKAGIVWLQIPAKSMLMNSKIGQRMADSCLHEEQRVAAAAQDGRGVVLVVSPNLKVNNVQELIALARGIATGDFGD